MLEWLKKWHVLLAVVFGVYFAIPKPVEPFVTFGDEYVIPIGTELTTKDGEQIQLLVDFEDLDSDELSIPRNSASPVGGMKEEDAKEKDDNGEDQEEETAPYLVEVTDEVEALYEQRTQSRFALKWPWAAFKWNLGQDLKGGTSLRYLIQSQEIVRSRRDLRSLASAFVSNETSKEAFESLGASLQSKVKQLASASPQVPDFSEAELNTLLGGSVPTGEQAAMFRASWADYQKEVVNQGAIDYVQPTIEKLNMRLNASGSTELNIVKAGNNEIEVKIPALSTAEKERLKSTLQTTGALEFLILPNEDVFGDKSAKDFHAGGVKTVPGDDPNYYEWYEVLPSQTAAALWPDGLKFDPVENMYVESNPDRTNPVFHSKFGHVLDRESGRIKFRNPYGEELEASVRVEECLVQTKHEVFDDTPGEALYPIGGDSLKDALPTTDQSGKPAVSFELKGRGVYAMETITGLHYKDAPSNDPRMLAVSIDRKLYSWASINGQLSDSIQVTGNFTREEVKRYVDTLKSGQLPVTLSLISEDTVGPAEGADNISRGKWSLVIGVLLVFAFAIFVYGRLGVLTMMNLILVVVLILATMAGFLSTMTLPGIAGLVLTLGMAIDANILINERIREELAAGASGRTAVETGFGKAFSAIVDGNVTTLITAIILSKVGTGAIAGFALTLSVGILCTLYVALLVYRTSYFSCFDKGWLKGVGGFQLFKNTNFNFVSVGYKLAAVTLVLAIVSFSVFIYDAVISKEVLGIDFRGGSQVVFELKEPMTREDLNASLKEKYPELQLQSRSHIGEEDAGGEGFTRWEMRVPSDSDEEAGGDLQKVSNEIRRQLEGILKGKLVDPGYHVEIVDPKKVNLRADVKIALPEGISPDNNNWAQAISGWSEPNEDEDNWFGSVGGQANRMVPTPDASQKFQTMTFELKGVELKDGDTLASVQKKFYDALKARLLDYDSEVMGAAVLAAYGGNYPEYKEATESEGGFPPRPKIVEGAVQATVQLNQPVSQSDFESFVRSQLQSSSDELAQRVESIRADSTDESGNSKSFTIKTANGVFTPSETGDPQTLIVIEQLKSDISSWLDSTGAEGTYVVDPFPQASAIGSRVAGETKARAFLALFIALIAIVIYIGVRFKSAGWGYAAVFALLHDGAFTLGALAVMDLTGIIGALKFDLTAIAALLTVIGYSLNDTIVIFDRIREELYEDLKTEAKRPLVTVINTAINKTLSRTFLTSASTFVVVLAMVILGGPAIKTFSWVLLFGLVFGTYSSVFRAGPLLIICTRGKRDIRLEIEAEEEARKEAERQEAELMAQISVDRDVDSNEDNE